MTQGTTTRVLDIDDRRAVLAELDRVAVELEGMLPRLQELAYAAERGLRRVRWDEATEDQPEASARLWRAFALVERMSAEVVSG